VNAVCDFDGDTALHRAVREGNADIVILLLSYGAKKSHKNLEGLTVIQLADRKKKVDVMNALETQASPQEPSRGPEGSGTPVPDSDGEPF